MRIAALYPRARISSETRGHVVIVRIRGQCWWTSAPERCYDFSGQWVRGWASRGSFRSHARVRDTSREKKRRDSSERNTAPRSGTRSFESPLKKTKKEPILKRQRKVIYYLEGCQRTSSEPRNERSMKNWRSGRSIGRSVWERGR